MSLKYSSTTADYLQWSEAMNLIRKLAKDGNYKISLLVALGCFTGLRISHDRDHRAGKDDRQTQNTAVVGDVGRGQDVVDIGRTVVEGEQDQLVRLGAVKLGGLPTLLGFITHGKKSLLPILLISPSLVTGTGTASGCFVYSSGQTPACSSSHAHPRCARKSEVLARENIDMKYHVGTMIEIPRAALLADEIAEEAEFFSFGTNDLTQMTFGFSRDDAGGFLNDYYEKKIFEQDPFARVDQKGVGKLIELAVAGGRKTRPNIKLGICGEHGGDPSSIDFCHRMGLTYVSCSPFRVPIARLAAAQAAITNG